MDGLIKWQQKTPDFSRVLCRLITLSIFPNTLEIPQITRWCIGCQLVFFLYLQINFFPMNSNLAGRRNPQLYLISLNIHDGNLHIVADHYALIELACQYQQWAPSLNMEIPGLGLSFTYTFSKYKEVPSIFIKIPSIPRENLRQVREVLRAPRTCRAVFFPKRIPNGITRIRQQNLSPCPILHMDDYRSLKVGGAFVQLFANANNRKN